MSNDLESTLRLSIIATRLLHDLAHLGKFEWSPDEMHQAVQLVSDSFDAAHALRLAEFKGGWYGVVAEMLPDGDHQ